MVLESTMICVDNSDYMRNGDFPPTRLHAQQDAVYLICQSKTQSNPENNVGLLTLANVQVLSTLTNDVGRIMTKLHQVQPNGNINILTGIKIAHMALKHRQGKHHRMRIVIFVGSPIETDENELVKLAKKLKKEKVNCDVVSFGEDSDNAPLLTSFVNTLNGKDNNTGGSHLVSVPAGGSDALTAALMSSPLIGGDEAGPSGSGLISFEFGVNPNEDPELALALRLSMEEERRRQEEESRRQQATTVEDPSKTVDTQNTGMEQTLDNEVMELSEEEQLALALYMSMQQEAQAEVESRAVSEEYDEVMNDPAFLQSVLESLPGVDPQSETLRNAIAAMKKDKDEQDDKKQKDKDQDGKDGSSDSK